MCDFCVFGRLHMCVCVCWWGGREGGQAGRIPAFQTPEKLSEAAAATAAAEWKGFRFCALVPPTVRLLTFDLTGPVCQC